LKFYSIVVEESTEKEIIKKHIKDNRLFTERPYLELIELKPEKEVLVLTTKRQLNPNFKYKLGIVSIDSDNEVELHMKDIQWPGQI